jgi:hypothetical protein
MDFTLADFDMPVLARQYVDLLQELAPDDFQRIPAQVGDLPNPFDIVNVLPSVPCLDTKRSELTYWTEADGHPHRIGEVRMVVTLKILAERVGNHHLFRIQEWPVPIIVSHAAHDILKNATGVELTPV